MPWDLEIHHIDTTTNGDSTLIVARFTGGDNDIVRSVLIDAGKSSRSENVHQYITQTVGLDRVDVIVASHYDNDHFTGIHKLLLMEDVDVYDHAILYDQGQPSALYGRTDRYRETPVVNDDVITYKPFSDYLKYINAINKKPNVKRATLRVNSFDLVRYGDGGVREAVPGNLVIPGPNYVNGRYYNGIPDPDGDGRLGEEGDIVGSDALPPDWLVGKEILWGNGGDNVGDNPAFGPINLGFDLPDNAPTLTCICANKWTLQPLNGRSYVSTVNIFANDEDWFDEETISDMENGYNSDGSGAADDNSKSLGFLLEFNDFRYYIAGDLETHQEDGDFNPNEVEEDDDQQLVFYPGVKNFLNPNDTHIDRLSAIHASHHGSRTSSSRVFLERTNPSGAVVSCSGENQFQHPHQEVINHFDGYDSDPINAAGFIDNQAPPRPPVSPWAPITNYLTGFQNPHYDEPFDEVPFFERTFGGSASFTAGQVVREAAEDDDGELEDDDMGVLPDLIDGHVVFKVSEQSSRTPRTGMVYRALVAALDQLEDFLDLDYTAQEKEGIADYGASFGGYFAVAKAVRAPIGCARAALDAAAWMGSFKFEDGEGDDEVIRTTSLVQIALDADDQDAAIVDVNAHEAGDDDNGRFDHVPVGMAEAISYAAHGGNAIQIAAKIQTQATVEAPIPNSASNAAGVAGAEIRNSFNGYAGAFAAAGALGAAFRDQNEASLGQAATIGAYIGAAASGCNSTQMVDAIFVASRAAGIGEDMAAIAAVTGAICHFWGDATETREIVFQALRFHVGLSTIPAAAKAANIRDAIDRTTQDGNLINEMFNVSFFDDNPDYGGDNPRTISHIT